MSATFVNMNGGRWALHEWFRREACRGLCTSLLPSSHPSHVLAKIMNHEELIGAFLLSCAPSSGMSMSAASSGIGGGGGGGDDDGSGSGGGDDDDDDDPIRSDLLRFAPIDRRSAVGGRRSTIDSGGGGAGVDGGAAAGSGGGVVLLRKLTFFFQYIFCARAACMTSRL